MNVNIHHPRIGFTLVELLVVVAMIVLLLALLAPALDKAVYEAELSICGSRLKSVGAAAMMYTGDHRRHYPIRVLVESSAAQPSRLLASLANVTVSGGDDRRMLAGYLADSHYLDPLVRKVDLSLVDRDSDLFVGYSLWFGFRYRMLGFKGIKRFGDRLEWIAQTDPDKTPRYFSVLASDIDFIRTTVPLTVSGHPDKAGLLRESVNLNAGAPVAMYRKQTNAWWTNNTATRRGPVDFNYAYEDGSVLRLNDVEWNEWQSADRIVRTAEYSTLTNEYPDYNQLPR